MSLSRYITKYSTNYYQCFSNSYSSPNSPHSSYPIEKGFKRMQTIKPPSRSFGGTSIRRLSLLRPNQAVKLKPVSVTRVCAGSVEPGMSNAVTSVGKATNIRWHDCQIRKIDRQNLLQQKGCVIWITGLSGSGKSTLACALSRELHYRGHMTYVLDGDNLRHGLNSDLTFKAEDRAENIRRVGEVAKLFADAGVICIACLISPYQMDRDACRRLLPESTFIEVFLDFPLEICEARDPKGLYKLARSGKIKGFTGIDDPYEPPLNCEIVIQSKNGDCPSPQTMAEQVVSYLQQNGFLHA